MAFLEGLSETKERFSLLLLDPGEIYFEDFSVFYYPADLSEVEAMKRKQRGRLKVCSKSIVFDPKDTHFPILKFYFKDISELAKWEGDLFSRLDIKDRVILVESEQVVQMKEANVIAPYVFKRRKSQYLFSLNYVTVDDSLPQMCQLRRASTLPLGDQNAMISAIVLSRQSRVKFDRSWLEDLYERLLMETRAEKITPLVTNPGRIMLTSTRLYFQPFNNVDPAPVLKIKLSDMKRVIKRRFLLRQVGLEIFCPEGSPCPHLYVSFECQEVRDELYSSIMQQADVQLEDTGQENMTLKWQDGLLSNYDYITYLNSVADRSIYDLTQYPVFPWVITDYTSPTLDLNDPSIFRDLSKPIGALNPERLHRLKERYKDMPSPRFLYGSHYSSPGYVLHFLARVAPEYMLCLQNGRFDHPDRMFNCLADAWMNCMQSATDFKELIPEFYSMNGDFLTNARLINFGSRQDGRNVHSVELPPWACGPQDFIRNLREALESDHVSQNLHHWIDLIFGYKQRGEEAEKADNVFYHLTYEGAVDLESVTDLDQRAALEQQIMEFGQTPKMLFTNPHPQRFSSSSSSSSNQTAASSGTADALVLHAPDIRQDMTNGLDAELKTAEDIPDSAVKTPNPWCHLDTLEQHLHHTLHKESVTDVYFSPDGKSVLSVSQDTLLKMYSLEEQRQLRSVNISSMALSSCIAMPDSKTIIVGSWDNNIYVYSMEYGRILDTVYAHDDAVSSLSLQDGLLVSASWDSTVKLWNIGKNPNNQSKIQLNQQAELDHETGVCCVDISPDKTLLLAGTRDGQLYLWDLTFHYILIQQQLHTGCVHAVRFSPDGLRVLSCGEDSYMRVMDVRSGTEIYAKHAGEEIRCAAWDGSTVLAGSASGDLLVWDLAKVQLVCRINAHQGAVTCLHMSSDGNIVTGGQDRHVLVWKLQPS